MKKKITGHCPCGYCFETLSGENEAVALIQAHFERFHQDFLPFGLTHEEAVSLLKVEYNEEVEELSLKKLYSAETEQFHTSKGRSLTQVKKQRKKAQTLEPIS